MEAPLEQPTYVEHAPEDLKLPSVPREEIRSIGSPNNITLPNLHTVLADLPERSSDQHAHPLTFQSAHNGLSTASSHARMLPQLDASSRTYGGFRPSTESVIISPSEIGGFNVGRDHGRRSKSIVSLEDPDVRLAAEALSGLGNAGHLRSPPLSQTSNISRPNTVTARPGSQHQESEPLLNLLVDAHPWVGGTINGSISAYTTTKNNSPRIVQYGANLIERNIGSPMASTVSSVGRRTGVESGIRRYLDSRRPSDLEGQGERSKRRRVIEDENAMDIDEDLGAESAMMDSQEFLPAYRSSKPPSYREESSPPSAERQLLRSRPAHKRNWSTQLMISTSGLGVALSESSLRSLTYTVTLLTKATEHVETAMHALKMILHEFDQTQEARQRDDLRHSKEVEAGIITHSQAERDEAARRLAERIKQLCDDIWETMKNVVNAVSTYAGGALPENARNLVKSQLLSIPQRWQLASQTAAQQDQNSPTAAAAGPSATEGEARKAAHRMIAFAEEGLDMMAQVNSVVQITLQSAEDWLRSLGRSNRARQDQEMDMDGSRVGRMR